MAWVARILSPVSLPSGRGRSNESSGWLALQVAGSSYQFELFDADVPIPKEESIFFLQLHFAYCHAKSLNVQGVMS